MKITISTQPVSGRRFCGVQSGKVHGVRTFPAIVWVGRLSIIHSS